MKTGKIIPNGVVLEKHEYKTVLFLIELGLNVELIPKSNIANLHSPDIKIGKEKWEMKAPRGEGKFLIQNTIQRAVKQSPNIIIDLRRTKRPERKCLQELMREFERSKSIKKLKIITKKHEVLDFKR